MLGSWIGRSTNQPSAGGLWEERVRGAPQEGFLAKVMLSGDLKDPQELAGEGKGGEEQAQSTASAKTAGQKQHDASEETESSSECSAHGGLQGRGEAGEVSGDSSRTACSGCHGNSAWSNTWDLEPGLRLPSMPPTLGWAARFSK